MTLFELIAGLKEARIHFEMTNVRSTAVMLQIAVPGERWEVEVFDDGHIEVERFQPVSEIETTDDARLLALISEYSESK